MRTLLLSGLRVQRKLVNFCLGGGRLYPTAAACLASKLELGGEVGGIGLVEVLAA